MLMSVLYIMMYGNGCGISAFYLMIDCESARMLLNTAFGL